MGCNKLNTSLLHTKKVGLVKNFEYRSNHAKYSCGIFRASKIDNLLIILKQEALSTLSINLVDSIGCAGPAQVVDSGRCTECVPGDPIKQLEIQAHDRRSD